MKYELNTIYEAFVDDDKGFARLYFTFDYDYYRITVKDAYDDDWKIYHIAGARRFTHSCSHGAWKMFIDQGGAKKGVRWEYQRGDHVHFPSVSLTDLKDPHVEAFLFHPGTHIGKVDEMKGKHYDALIIDDMPIKECSSTTTAEAKRAIEWYKKVQSIYGYGKWKNFTEGGNEMTKQLYHVILFNRKTEEIDFKAYIPAQDEEAAAMTAVQAYGKYDAKVHKHLVKLIEGSEYEVVK